MKTPKFTLILTSLITLAFLAQDFLFGQTYSNLIDFLQNISFLGLGGFLGTVLFGNKFKSNQKADLINPQKLAEEIVKDEKKQLQEKIKTLEAALNRALK